MAATTVSEDTRLDKLPSNVTHKLKKILDQKGNLKHLFTAVEDSLDDRSHLDTDLDQLRLLKFSGKSPTEILLSKLGNKGYQVCHLQKWLRDSRLLQAAELLEGTQLFVCYLIAICRAFVGLHHSCCIMFVHIVKL